MDFKELTKGLEPVDIVAFANSDRGGAILVGVAEIRKAKVPQQSLIKGCKVGDKEKLAIMNKASSCVPPISVEVYVENSSRKPFYRIEIPRGAFRPYCTASGHYAIRSDGLNSNLLPKQLLAMFMEVESGVFIERFREATKELGNEFGRVKGEIINDMVDLSATVDVMGVEVQNTLGDLSTTAEDSHSYIGDLEQAIGSLDYKVIDLSKGVYNVDNKLKVILQHLGIEDPWIKTAKQIIGNFVTNLEPQERKKPRLRKKMLKYFEANFPDATSKQLSNWYKEAVAEAEDIRSKANGQVCDQPVDESDG